MTTQEQLQQVFADNFVAYFRSHVAHVNIVGRNFVSDHKLLQKIYEDLQGQIDTIAELLRSMDEFMPNQLSKVTDTSHIMDSPLDGDSDYLLTAVYDDIEHLKGCYEELIKVGNLEGYDHISNYAQDRVLQLSKFCWMLKSTLS
jgi:starvation-inducible DNA-binding protein